MLCNEMHQHLENLQNSVNEYFLNDSTVLCLGKVTVQST